MYKLTSPSVALDIMHKHGFHTIKAFGQNFLADEHYVNSIVDAADISNDDVVIEVGPGIGTLTQLMCMRAKHVIAIEIDKKLIPVLNDTLADFDNLTIVNEDVLKTDIKAIVNEYSPERAVKIVSNLPYYITTPVIMRFIEEDVPFSLMVLMVQSEVADRLSASSGNKDYGVLSVMLQCVCDIEFMFKVPASVFIPRPQVSSGVIRLRPKEKRLTAKNSELFRSIVKGAFMQRRKTLLNSLSSVSELKTLTKVDITEILSQAGIPATERCENLSIEQFIALTDSTEAYLSK